MSNVKITITAPNKKKAKELLLRLKAAIKTATCRHGDNPADCICCQQLAARPSKSEPITPTTVLAVCPSCGLDFPDRDAKTEPEYECTECGKIGYDCCVPGKGMRCNGCQEDAEDA